MCFFIPGHELWFAIALASEWKGPSPLPPWAEKEYGDNENVQNLKDLLYIYNKDLRDVWSKYRAKLRYSEELERFVADMKKNHIHRTYRLNN